MHAALRTAAVALGIAIPSAAHAQHAHGGGSASSDERGAFRAGLSLVAARFNNPIYGGDYQGVTPSLQWSNARFAVVSGITLYRLQENGRELFGPGDVFADGRVTVVRRGRTTGGVALAVLIPTGNARTGLGMGHVMVMPAAWAAVRLGRVGLAASAGYGRGFGDEHHVHGAWPLVDPMSSSELTWSAGADVAVAGSLHAGARVLAAAPLEAGVTRVASGVRAGWTTGRIATGVELQAGLAGDPFTVRGVVETTLRF